MRGEKITFQRHALSRRVINDLKKRSITGVFFYMVIPFCILFTDSYAERHHRLSILFVSIFTSISLFRFIHLYFFGQKSEKFETLNNNIFFGGVVLTAMTWGMGAAYFLSQQGEPKTQLVTAICTVGFCSGGVVSFIPERRLAILYNLLMLLPAATNILIKGENLTLGVAILFFSVYLILIALRGNNEYWTALENEYLLEKKSRELKLESRIDVLTTLFNRRHFDELFQLAFGLCSRRGTPITLVMCDIDYFKKVNDTFGHMAGDEYLKLVSRCLKDVFRRETEVIARYGGEEFVIVLPDQEIAATRQMAECFRNTIANTTLEFNGKAIKTTISLGMTCCIPASGQIPTELIERADSALYMAKNSGRNRVVVHGEY